MKKNPLDEEIRKLTRLAEGGDESAIKRLHAAQRRAGVPLNERWGYQALGDAVEEEHGECDNNTCDITAALNAGYYLWAARLLEGATEAPKTEAALAASGATEDELEEDRKGFVEGVHHLQCGCGAFVWGEDETTCGNCLGPLTRDVERPDPIPGELPADLADKDILRHVDLDGYRLVTWSTGRVNQNGQSYIGYRLYGSENASEEGREPIFEGTDFTPGASADDSDEALRGLIGFLTLRPGDTDREYFDGYTPRQMAFAENEAEQLSIYALDDGPLPTDVIGGEDQEYCARCDAPVFPPETTLDAEGLCAGCAQDEDDRRQSRENPDEEMRHLERQAQAGDTQAAARLEWARMRIGERGERKYLADLAIEPRADQMHGLWAAALKAVGMPATHEEIGSLVSPQVEGEVRRGYLPRKAVAVGVKAVLIAAGFDMKQISVTTPSHWTGGVNIAGPSLAPFRKAARQAGTLPEKLGAQKRLREIKERGYVDVGGGGYYMALKPEEIQRIEWLFYARSVPSSHALVRLNVRDRQGSTDEERRQASMADVSWTSEGPSLSSLWWDVFKAGVKRGLEGKRKNL